MVGDATGAVLEFARYRITEEHVRHAMTLPGGGPLAVAPGQFTDDSELQLALLTALARDTPADVREFPALAVARRYIEWHRSEPFDMGGTCRKAFGFATDDKEVTANALRYGMLNESNGAAMRCAPVAVWGACRGMSVTEVMEHARAEARLSHPSRACLDANALICGILAFVIGTAPSSPPSVVARACLAEIDTWSFVVRGEGKVCNWVNEARTSSTLPPGSCVVNDGYVKHAIVAVIVVLRRFAEGSYTSYEQALRDVLLAGGDTDTNACIVGYVTGALCGADGIPRAMRDRVLGFDCTAVRHTETNLLGNPRPETYRASNVIPLVESLMNRR